MLNTLFKPKTLKFLEKEKSLLEKDFSVMRKLFNYLVRNERVCLTMLNFSLQPVDVERVFKEMLKLEHLIVKLQNKEKIIEIKSIEIIENHLKGIEDEEVIDELHSINLFLKEQKRLLQDVLSLTKILSKNKFSKRAIESSAMEIRKLIRRQTEILKNNKHIINNLLGRLSEDERKIKKLLKRDYGRCVGKHRAKKMRKSLLLGDNPDLIPCFVLTKKIENLLDRINEKGSREKLKNIFRGIGTKGVEVVILFRLDEKQDLSILSECPDAQPQRIEGLIEQKLKWNTKIEIISVYSL